MLGMGAWCVVAHATPLDSTSQRVRIVRADAILRDPAVTGAERIVGDVLLAHRDVELQCDSAWRFDDGRFRAMGHVQANRPGDWQMLAESLEWDPLTEQLHATGSPVRLTEDEMSIEGPSIRYELKDEVAWYSSRSTLTTVDQTAKSNRGWYHAATGWMTLAGEVEVQSQEELVKSDSLQVQAQGDGVRLLGHSVVKHMDGDWAISCEQGWLSADSGWVAGALRRAWVRRGVEGVWADSLAWSEIKGLRQAWGHVEAVDTALTQVVRGDYLVQFLSDSLWNSRVEGHQNSAVLVQIEAHDTLRLEASTLEQVDGRLRAFPEVFFSQGGALGKCDTLIWLESDGIIRFENQPLMWFEGQTLEADTIIVTLRNKAPERLHGLGHAFLTKQVNDSCADQITGRQLTGFFEDGAIHRLLVEGNGEAIYFVEDEGQLQFNRASCSRMRIELESGRVRDLTLLDAPNGRFMGLKSSTQEERWLKGAAIHSMPELPELGDWPPEISTEAYQP